MNIKFKLAALTQTSGIVGVQLEGTMFPSTLVIDGESSLSNSAATVTVLFRTQGMTKLKKLLDPDTGLPVVISGSSPYPCTFIDIAMQEIAFEPVNFAAGESFNVGIHWRYE